MAKTMGITNSSGKYTMGSNKDASVRKQATGAAKSFNPKAPAVGSKKGGISSVGELTGNSPKTYSPPPQQGGRASKVAGTSSAAGANKGLSYGAGKKLGNHYSNS